LVTKVYDKGYVCDCGPEPLKASGGNDTLLQEQLEPNAPEEKDRQFQEPDTVLLDQAPPRRVEAPEGDSVTDIGTAKAAGPGGDCICRRKMTTNYIYSHDGRLLRVYEDGQLLRQYLYAGDQRIAVYEKQGLNFDLYYYLPDHLGSTRALVDNTGNVSSTFDYYPYGALKASSVNTDTKMRYTGKELDDEEIEQYYFGARYLNGATLRFNSIDPQGGRYPGWSPYCYALANPMKNVDRDGEQTFSYDFSKFLERREKLLGWAPGWVQETVMPVDPMIGPPVMAVGRFAEPIEVAAKTGARAAKPGIARLIAKARKFLQAAANKAERTVEGKGAKAGIAKHEVLKQEIEAHGKKLKLSSEVSYKGRDPVKYGKKGSVRVDVVLGSKKNPIATFDLKTGRATLTPQRMRILRAHLPKKTPIEQIKPTGLIE
jgi:RHS repeat-associated protein